MDAFRQDIRFALRTFKKSPGVTLLAAGSVALAIAGNATVFSMVNGLLFRPLPYQEPRRIVVVGERARDLPGGSGIKPTSAANYLDIRERQTSFTEMAAFRPLNLSLDSGEGEPEPLLAAAVTPELFSVLGVSPQAGRFFLPEEATPGNHRVVVLSHETWSRRFGARDDLLGTALDLGGEPYDVVGIAKQGFALLTPGIDLYLPLALDRSRIDRHRRDVIAFARLEPGVSDGSAKAEVSAILKQLASEHAAANRGYVADVRNLRDDLPGPRAATFFGLIQGVALGVLLIACVNSASLLLARGQARRREIAIRTAIGATRRRIVAQLLTESLTLALFAGVAGIALGRVGISAARNAFAALLPSFWLPVLDPQVVAFSLGVALLGGLFFGLAPVAQTARFDLFTALKDATPGSTAGGRRRILAGGLVVAELALALLSLAVAGILLRTFRHMQTVDPGFETANVLMLELRMPEMRYATGDELTLAVEQLEERLASLPGVSGVAITSSAPRSLVPSRDSFTIDGRPSPADQSPPMAVRLSVSAGTFEALGMPLTSGRLIGEGDRAGAPEVVLINQIMARRYWHDADPLGRRLTIRGRSREIVGVVGDLRHDLVLGDSFMPAVYLPIAQEPQAAIVAALKTAVEPAGLADVARRTVRAAVPAAAIVSVQTLDAYIDRFWVGQRLLGDLLRIFGALGLFLAAVGTYGVLAYAVEQRTPEIGVRMAIGASRRRILVMFARQGLTLAALGLLIGMPLVLAANRLIVSAAEGFQPVGSGAVAGVALLLVVVIVLASLLPARRAASVDPIRALRWE